MSARAAAPQARHIHLPSVHVRVHVRGVRAEYDYNEDLFIERRGRGVHVLRVVGIEIRVKGAPGVYRETRDTLSREEALEATRSIEFLTDEGNPVLEDLMKQRAALEFERQVRIASGDETACLGCGCSESRACSGGCVWATPAVCSRCVR